MSTITNFPSQQSRINLDSLSQNFTPNDVKFLLALNAESSLEECIDSAEGMITRLSNFINNGHSTEGLHFSYSEVKRY